MRQDFGRCVIERPRRGSSNPSLKIKKVGRFRYDEDGELYFDGPTRVPNSGNRMRAIDSAIGEKDFTDVLGPVHGYLQSCIGRRWDDVYSELMRNLGSGSYPIAHILYEHLLRDVDTHTFWEDGKVYGDQPGARIHNADYYVHPLTGVLCYAPYSYHYKYRPTRMETDRVHIVGDRWYVQLNDIWFIGRYHECAYATREIDTRVTQYLPLSTPRGWIGNRTVYRIAFPEYAAGNKEYHFIKEKQANKKELRDLRRRQAKRGRKR